MTKFIEATNCRNTFNASLSNRFLFNTSVPTDNLIISKGFYFLGSFCTKVFILKKRLLQKPSQRDGCSTKCLNYALTKFRADFLRHRNVLL